MPLTKKIALITGGTRGIGATIADHFEALGASLILTGTDPGAIAELNSNAPGSRRYLQVDFSSVESTEEFLRSVESEPVLDICVNNAGINILAPMEDATPEELERMTRVDYLAPFRTCQSAARVMKRAGKGGKIVNIASIWSVVAKAQRSMYSAAKTGVVGMTRAFAVDLAPHNILVNAISPGFILTDLTRQNLAENEREQLAAQVPLGRFGEPVEIAKAAAFLGGADNTYLTGQNIVIDGGFTHV